MNGKQAAEPRVESALDAIGRAQSLLEEARRTLDRLGLFRKEQGEVRRVYDCVGRLFYAVARARDAATAGPVPAGDDASSTDKAESPRLVRG